MTETRPIYGGQAPTRAPRSRAREWYRIQNAADTETTEVWIYDVIDSWLGVSAEQFVKDLGGITTPRISVRLNSPGGVVWDGYAIYNSLQAHDAEIEVRIDGLAASAASLIAMAGDTVLMAKPSRLMIHDAWGMTLGNARDHQKVSEMLDSISDQIAGVYADRAGGSVREWRDRMLEETWYTETEAVAAGLADEVVGAASTDVKNHFDTSIFAFFRHPPADLLEAATGRVAPPSKREVEQALRDAGLSTTEAKTMIARGWPADTSEREAVFDRLEKSLAALRA